MDRAAAQSGNDGMLGPSVRQPEKKAALHHAPVRFERPRMREWHVLISFVERAAGCDRGGWPDRISGHNGHRAARAPLSRTLARPYANLGRAPVNQQRPRFTGTTTDRHKAAGASSRHTRSALWPSEKPRVPTPAGRHLLGEEICRQGRHQCRYSCGRERGKRHCAVLRQTGSTSCHRPRR